MWPILHGPIDCAIMKLISLIAASTVACGAVAGPGLTAVSAILIDADTGKVLFAKNADVQRFPASTTKIMTALLLLENVAPDEQIVAPSDVESVKGSSLHLKPYETISGNDMLYALMLRSANDASYATAMHISGSVPAFAKLMNERAKEIGCTKTNFNNPNGLNDPKHKTTARDLAIMAREAMRYPEFRAAVSTRKHPISRTINFEDLVVVNKNKILAKDPTADGIKTGYTIPAGHCFVGSASRNGYRVITVVLKSEDWQKDTKVLTDWAFKMHGRIKLKEAGVPIQTTPIQDGSEPVVAVAPERDIFVIGAKTKPLTAQITLDPTLIQAPIAAGQRVGSFVVKDTDGFEFRVPALAAAEVGRRTIFQSATTGWGGPLLGIVLVGGSFYMRGKARRTRPYAKRTASRRYY